MNVFNSSQNSKIKTIEVIDLGLDLQTDYGADDENKQEITAHIYYIPMLKSSLSQIWLKIWVSLDVAIYDW